MEKTHYKCWVKDAVHFINETIEKINQHQDKEKLQCINVGATQYLPDFKDIIDVDLVFLGHDAHEGKKPDDKFTSNYGIIKRFFKGNGKPQEWRNTGWRIWNNFESLYARVLNMLGYEELVDVVGNKKMVLSEKMLDKLVVTNAVLFNYIDKAEELNYLLGSVDKNIVNECMRLTARLIFDVIKPKLVICSSTNLVYAPLIAQYNKYFKKEVSPNIFQIEGRKRLRVGKCEIKHDDGTFTKVIGIPHTSYQSNLTKNVVDFILKENTIGEVGYVTKSSPSIGQNWICTNKYKQPTKEEVKEIFFEIITHLKSILGNPIESNDKTQRFKLNNDIAITITKSVKGYIGIRHTLFNNKRKYSNEEYPNTQKYTHILNQHGYNILPNNGCWIGTKFLKRYGYDKESIILNIKSEINEIVKHLNNEILDNSSNKTNRR